MSNTTLSNTSSDRFIARLETLDVGARARLKRNAGRSLNEARDVYQVFFSILPPWVIHQRDQETYFMVATLYAVGTRREGSRSQNPPPSLGASLRRVRGDSGDDRRISLDKRVEALLEANREQLPFRLRQLVRLLLANEVAVDWRRLLRDVRQWEIGAGRVQRRWAEHYFVGTNETSDAAATAASETSSVVSEE